MPASLRAMIAIGLLAYPTAAFAERRTLTTKAVVACTTWAAWREFGQASLATGGARLDDLCPVRLAARTRVIMVEQDAGAGASEIRYRGKRWFVDAQTLD